ncbi:hypothetical protein [Algoriphagus sp. Y33]|uniref:hypothetical protein n=1 Tax=Algoriphagus sp. Y33 TaxID=2772483 RepID=UPI001CE0949D|nr:hypothetical protein [Algoriphagus sp. Y33]
MEITLSDRRTIKIEAILELYRANEWSSADKPSELYNGLMNSHSLFSAWDKDRLVGIAMLFLTVFWSFTILIYLFTRIFREKELER